MAKNQIQMVVGLATGLMAAATMNTSARPRVPAADRQWPVGPPYADARGIEQDVQAVRDFDARVLEYVALHRLLEGPAPQLHVSTEMRTVRAAMDALAQRIQTARQDSHQGDIFTADIAVVVRKRIAACLTPEEWQRILSEQDETAPAAIPPLRVNARWPPLMPFGFVPPQLLAVLPLLPPELQYRIIGRSLVLWDHHADLIVDFMPGAFTT